MMSARTTITIFALLILTPHVLAVVAPADGTVPGVKSTLETASDAVTDAFASVKDRTAEAYEAAKEQLAGIQAKVEPEQSYYDSAMESLQQARDSVDTSKAREYYESARTNLQAFVDTAKDRTSEAYTSAKEQLADIQAKLTPEQSYYDSAMESLQQARDSVDTSKAREYYESAHSSLQSFLRSAKDHTSDAYASAKQQLSSIQDYLSTDSSQSYYDSAMTSLQQARDSVDDSTARRYYENARSSLRAFLDTTKDRTSNTYKSAKEQLERTRVKLSEMVTPSELQSYYEVALDNLRKAGSSLDTSVARQHLARAHESLTDYVDLAADRTSSTYKAAKEQLAVLNDKLAQVNAQSYYDSAMDSLQRARDSVDTSKAREYYEEAKQSFTYYLDSAKDHASDAYKSAKAQLREIQAKLQD